MEHLDELKSELTTVLSQALVGLSYFGERERIKEDESILLQLRKNYRFGNERRICEIEGCERPHVARGWCMRHYSLLFRRGSSLDREHTSQGFPGVRDDLTEDEFCVFKDKRAQGFSSRDIALELRKNLTVITIAWDFETYSRYKDKNKGSSWDFNDAEGKV